MVVDTSVLLAVFFAEPLGPRASERLTEHALALRMSTVNLTEALIRLRDRQPQLYSGLEEQLLNSGIRFLPPDIAQARIAAEARLRYPLNLGDCFAYALAVREDCPILTLDRNFANLDCPVILPPSE